MSDCPREPDLVGAVVHGTGRQLSDHEREHVRECASCAEAVGIAGALVNDVDNIPAPPTAEVVWFRAQFKARADAGEAAARPMMVVQAVAAAAATGAVAAIVGSLSALEVVGLATRGLLLAFAVWLLIVPLAVYLAATEE
jgi:hypothetical protein